MAIETLSFNYEDDENSSEKDDGTF